MNLEKLEHDITLCKSPNVDKWLVPIDDLQEMIALIKRQEAELRVARAAQTDPIGYLCEEYILGTDGKGWREVFSREVIKPSERVRNIQAVFAAIPPAIEAPQTLSDEQIDVVAVPYVGLGGVENYRAFARDIAAAIQPAAAPAVQVQDGDRANTLTRDAFIGDLQFGIYNAEIEDMRAAITAKSVAVPDGWEIHRIGQTIRINHEAVGRVFLPRDCKDPSDVVLYHLAESLLTASPSPAQAQPVAQPSLRHSEEYVSDLEDSLKQIADAIGYEGGADGLIERVKQIGAQPVADPMDWPLPCDVTVGNGTHKKGVPLRSLVARMNVLHGMAKSQPVADAEQDPRVTVAMVQDQLKMAMDLIETMRSADKMDYEFGRAAGIEEAAKVCAYSLIDSPTIYEAAAIRKCADAIRALAAKPVE